VTSGAGSISPLPVGHNCVEATLGCIGIGNLFWLPKTSGCILGRGDVAKVSEADIQRPTQLKGSNLPDCGCEPLACDKPTPHGILRIVVLIGELEITTGVSDLCRGVSSSFLFIEFSFYFVFNAISTSPVQQCQFSRMYNS